MQRPRGLARAAPIVATTSAAKNYANVSDTASTATTFAGTIAVADTTLHRHTATAITATTVAATGVAATATVHNSAITMESFMETRSAPNAFDDGHKNDHT